MEKISSLFFCLNSRIMMCHINNGSCSTNGCVNRSRINAFFVEVIKLPQLDSIISRMLTNSQDFKTLVKDKKGWIEGS